MEKGRGNTITDINEAIDFIYSFINYEKKSNFAYNTRSFDIKKFEEFLEGLGSPHRKYKTIHVVGTKGKGSTCSILASILTHAGFRTGLYTSPHLENIRERIKIDGLSIDEENFTSIVEKLRMFINSNSIDLARNFRTTFELLTATAFIYFAQKNVDFAVIEAGLGGRLDATNVISPEIVLITSISLDHTNILGDSLEKIASEKGGAIKSGVPIYLSEQNENVVKVLEDICWEKKAQVFLLKQEEHIKNQKMGLKGNQFDYVGAEGNMRKLWLSLAGDYQGENALLAIKGFYHLAGKDGLNGNSAIRKGLSEVRLRGRLEILSTEPLIVADVAHNPYSMQKLLSRISQIFEFKRILCVLSISTNKDIPGLCKILSDYSSHFYVTCAEPMRSSPFDAIEEQLAEPENRVYFDESPGKALELALGDADKNDLILITGSVYLVGNLLLYFDNDDKTQDK